LFVGGLKSYLRYLCLFAYSVLWSNTYCVVFLVLFLFVLCTMCCQFLWIVYFRLLYSLFVDRFLFFLVFHCFVCPSSIYGFWLLLWYLQTFLCPFSFDHCVVCPTLIYGFWLPLWYLQTFLSMGKTVLTNVLTKE